MESLDPIRDFARLMEQTDEQIHLDEAALLLARTEYPKLDFAPPLECLDRLAARLDCDPNRSPLENVQGLNDLLFEQENFSGNTEDYDDPRNSYLNDVLERKKGIPITLSLVYMEVARRRALPVVGVGFPGHFLVKYFTGPGEILLDPYNRGIILSRQDCEERLKAQFGEESELKAEYLAASTHKQVLARVLNNLKGSYLRRRDFPKVLTMIELALAVEPGSLHEIHDRGMVYFLIRRYAEAKADFQAYLSLAPPEDSQVPEVAQMLHRIRGLMN
jgi:regulator of sirC expression with transglutaminase-like and TPR domain